MPVSSYRFVFGESVPFAEAEMTLQLSIFAVEGLFGRAGVRLEAGYDVDEPHRVLVVDASTEVGASLVRVFTSLLLREFGDSAFSVRRGEGPQPPTPPAAAAPSPAPAAAAA